MSLRMTTPHIPQGKDLRATNSPPTPTISSNTSNSNFEIAILFNVGASAGNYVFGYGKPPTALRSRVVSYGLGAYKA